MKKNFCSWISGFLLLLLATTTTAQSPNNAYVVKKGDWLRKIAQTAYGNSSSYQQIITATNRKAALDKSFAVITDPNQLPLGKKIWIPAREEMTSSSTLIPKTNCEIRLWYNYQVVAIGVLNEKWKADGLSLERRARKAYQTRHDARIHARFMMADKGEVLQLQQRDIEKYGNPDGPTFDYLFKKFKQQGGTTEQIYQAIIDSSSRTDKQYNADCP